MIFMDGIDKCISKSLADLDMEQYTVGANVWNRIGHI